MPPIIERLKVPVGSLVVDAALVLSLVYYGGQLTERLENLDARLQKIESVRITPDADRRISVLETQLVAQAQIQAEFKRDLTDRLQRIEQKLDKH